MELPDFSGRRRILRYRDLPGHVKEQVDLVAAKSEGARELVERVKAMPLYEYLAGKGFTHVHITPSRNLVFTQEKKTGEVRARTFLPKSKVRPMLRIPLK